MAATRPVVLRQNVGMLVARTTKVFTGELCRDCLTDLFCEYSGKTALIGWLGVVSLLVTPVYLAQNLRELWAARHLPRPAPDAELATAVAERLRPLIEARAEWINGRFAAGGALPQVARELAHSEGLDPLAVEVSLRLLAAGPGS